MKKLLEYQELDKKLKKLKKESGNLSNQKNQSNQSEVAEINNIIRDAQNKILELEETSKKLLASLDKMIEVEKKGLAYVEKCKKTSLDDMEIDDLKDFETRALQTSKQLAELENRFASHSAEVKKVVLDYKMHRKVILDAKEKRDALKVKSEETEVVSNPEIDAVKKQMAEIEKQIEPAKFAKYKALKQDGIFPVLVPLSEKRCGGCRVELSSAALDKLKSGTVYECEQCHRIIYLDKE